jgi:CheY-like chemotaxis protein
MDASQSRSDSTGKLRVLVVDDEKNIRTTLSLCLEQMDCYVKAVSSVDGALAALRHESFDVAFLDLRLGEANGLEIIPKLLAESAELMIVMMTAFATIDSAVEAIKRGAFTGAVRDQAVFCQKQLWKLCSSTEVKEFIDAKHVIGLFETAKIEGVSLHSATLESHASHRRVRPVSRATLLSSCNSAYGSSDCQSHKFRSWVHR